MIKRIINGLIVLFLLFLSLTIIFPLWNQLILSLSSVDSTNIRGSLFVQEWSLTAYSYIYENMNILRVFFNTVIRTVLGTLILLTTTVLVAYPLSQNGLPYRKAIFIFFLIAMYVSGGIIPEYLVVKKIGILNTFFALILPRSMNVYYIFIMYRFFRNQDKSIIEAARLDGANPFQILFHIVIPSSLPIITTIGLWSAVYYWNEWFHAKIYIQDKSLLVLQAMLQSMLWTLDPQNLTQNTGGVGTNSAGLLLSNVQAATVVILVLPILIVYPFIQKYVIKRLDFGDIN